MPQNQNANDAAIADYANRKILLEQAMTANSYNEFTALLEAKPNDNSFHNDLITLHYDEFVELCNAAPIEYKIALMDFRGMNLADKDLSRLDLFHAKFTKSDLTKAVGLTQESLDKSDYADAILPKGFIPAWTDAKKELVLDAINELSLYGKKLTQLTPKDAHKKGTDAIALAKMLTQAIDKAPRQNGEFQQDLLKYLKTQESEFGGHRSHGLIRILQNIGLCILSLGVGYLIAGTVNYYSTGRFVFFDQTMTQKKIALIEDQISSDDKINGLSLLSLIK